MSDERTKAIIGDVVEALRGVLRKHEVTFAEYRAGFMHMAKTQEAGELPMLIDVFLNSTVVEIENATRTGSKAAIQGPYFVPDAPFVEGQLAIRDQDMDLPKMLMRGRVTDQSGAPVAGAVIDLWHSTPEGTYSGIPRHGDLDKKYYRGKIKTDADGKYECISILPVPYQIPNKGPTGMLLETYMGWHSWRPAHIHYWIHADGKRDLISQAYFEGGDYVDDDCCEGVGNEFIVPEAYENGMRLMEVDFVLDEASSPKPARVAEPAE
ncbi:MAG: chlorocatechol 1,2-dioxygenase [Paracoccaceae bacterium]|nr:chlorocatechol 1,2-dioxygenase [Paracoccaceae bacterium]